MDIRDESLRQRLVLREAGTRQPRRGLESAETFSTGVINQIYSPES